MNILHLSKAKCNMTITVLHVGINKNQERIYNYPNLKDEIMLKSKNLLYILPIVRFDTMACTSTRRIAEVIKFIAIIHQ